MRSLNQEEIEALALRCARREAPVAALIEALADATSAVTRFEVIDHTAGGEGRILTKRGVRVDLLFQDDGRTLKALLTDNHPDLKAGEALPVESK